MTAIHKYGVISYEGASPGDSVRYVPSPQPGKPGAILKPRSRTEINAILEKVQGTRGFIRLKPQLQSAQAGAEAGGASGIRVDLPVSARGRMKIG